MKKSVLSLSILLAIVLLGCGNEKQPTYSNSSKQYSVATTQTHNASNGKVIMQFVGNSSSGKFHKTNCEWAKKTSESKRVYFADRNAALGLGYVPCKVCAP